MAQEALNRTCKAYGQPTIARGLTGAVNILHDPDTMRFAAQALGMSITAVENAARALRLQALQILPDSEITGRASEAG